MTDIRMGITLTADGRGLVGEFRLSEQEALKLAAAVDKLGRESKDAAKDTDRLTKEQREAARESRRLNTEQKNLGRQLNQTARNANLLRFAVVALATGIGARLVGSFIEAGETTEQYQLRLRRLLGDVEEASMLFDDMADFASRVPFEYRDIMESATALSGVLAGGREEISEIMPLIADLAAVTQLSISDTTQQVVRMFSAGAASADLFRERGILAMLGFQAGVSVSGEETRRRLIEAWEDPLSKFRGAADDLAKTWSGQLSMMADRWFAFQNDVSKSGPYEFLVAALAELNETFDETADETEESAERIGKAIVDAMEDILVGGAVAVDAMTPVFDAARDGMNELIENFNDLPPLMQEMGLLGMFLLGWKGRAILVGAMALYDDIAAGAKAYADQFDETRGDIREGLGLDPEGGIDTNLSRNQSGTAQFPDQVRDLLAGRYDPRPANAPDAFESDAESDAEKTLVPLLERSIFGSAEDSAQTFVEELLSGIRARMSEADEDIGSAFGLGANNDGTGEANEKLRDRIDDMVFELELMERTEREQAVLNELRKAGVDATIQHGESLDAFLSRLTEEERLLGDLALLSEERRAAIEMEIDAEERHAETVDDIKERLLGLQAPYRQAIVAAEAWRSEALANLDPVAEGYAEFAAQVEEIYGTMLVEAYHEDLRNRQDWAAGVERALRDAADDAADHAGAFEDLTTGALDEAEDAWVNFVTNRKVDLADLGRFIEDWAARYLFRLAIEPGLEAGAGFLQENGSDIIGSIIGSIVGGSSGSTNTAPGPASAGIFHGGGIAGSGGPTLHVHPTAFAAAQRYHSGGIAGLAPDEVPAVLQRGERISTPQQFDNMNGVLSILAARQQAPSGRDVKIEIINNTGQATEASAERVRGPSGEDMLRITLEPLIRDSIARGAGGQAIEDNYVAPKRLTHRD